jgi:hypothetical protein
MGSGEQGNITVKRVMLIFDTISYTAIVLLG